MHSRSPINSLVAFGKSFPKRGIASTVGEPIVRDWVRPMKRAGRAIPLAANFSMPGVGLRQWPRASATISMQSLLEEPDKVP